LVHKAGLSDPNPGKNPLAGMGYLYSIADLAGKQGAIQKFPFRIRAHFLRRALPLSNNSP
jgi:hypothetical protein